MVTKRKPRKKAAPVVVQPVEKVRVDRATWAEAMRLADGDSKRIEIISASECIVHNPGWRAGG